MQGLQLLLARCNTLHRATHIHGVSRMELALGFPPGSFAKQYSFSGIGQKYGLLICCLLHW